VTAPPTVASGARAAAQDGTDAGRQLSRRERFHDVVVGSQLQSDDPVDLVTACREHDHGEFGVAPDLPAQVPAIPVRQHHVEEHEFRRLPAQLVPGSGQGAAQAHVEALAA
jgi:hypothetical protein